MAKVLMGEILGFVYTRPYGKVTHASQQTAAEPAGRSCRSWSMFAFSAMDSLLRHLLLMLSLLTLSGGTHAQSGPRNDGFQRHDGTMYLIRNGQRRPMPHDVQLPNGRTITRDGFIVDAAGQRRELSEGQGCTLAGEPTAVTTASPGQLALAAPGRPPEPGPVRMVAEPNLLEQFLGPRGKGPKGWGHHKKRGKHKRH
jgi:hypothetical protein